MSGISVEPGNKAIAYPLGVDLDQNNFGGAMVFLDPKKISDKEAIEFLTNKQKVGSSGNLYIITQAETPRDDERTFANRGQGRNLLFNRSSSFAREGSIR